MNQAMATVQLFQPMNLTAHSNLGKPHYGDTPDWIVATYPGQVRVSLHDRYGDDSGYFDKMKVTKAGAPVLEIGGFSLDANGSWAEDAADAGDLRPFYSRILGGADRMIGSTGNDVFDGFSGADHMNGAAGNDWLVGGLGNDTLIGGAGNDTLVGGAGNDTFTVGQ